MGLRGFFSSLPLISQVDRYYFYIPGYTESLGYFSEVRVVLSEEWLDGVPFDLQDYFFRVGFPNYFIPIFRGNDCYGFVVKSFNKMTPRFSTNAMMPGCERINGGELVVLVEGFKDVYIPLLVSEGLPVVVIPLLTALPGRELLGFFKQMGCSVLYIPDNDSRIGDHSARFSELIGSVGVRGSIHKLGVVKDFGDFFSADYVIRQSAVQEGRRLRHLLKTLTTL